MLALLASENPEHPVTGPTVQAATGLSRSRAYAVCAPSSQQLAGFRPTPKADAADAA